jgi:hypothetical protein
MKFCKDGRTYFVRSDGRCVNKMCNIKLKYNGTLSKRNDGCLSFILLTRGQPGLNQILFKKIKNLLF